MRRATSARWRDSYGTEHTELDLNPEQDLPGAIEELAYYCDEPNADSGALPVWFLSKLTKASATVALSGEGADELFGGYLMQRASLLARHGSPIASTALLRALLALARRWPVSNDKIGFEYKLKRFLEGCRMPAARAHVYWSGTFDDQRKAIAGAAGSCPGARFRIAANWPRRRQSAGSTSGSTRNIFFPTTS